MRPTCQRPREAPRPSSLSPHSPRHCSRAPFSPVQKGLDVAFLLARLQSGDRTADVGRGPAVGFGQIVELRLGDLAGPVGRRVVDGVQPVHPLDQIGGADAEVGREAFRIAPQGVPYPGLGRSAAPSAARSDAGRLRWGGKADDPDASERGRRTPLLVVWCRRRRGREHRQQHDRCCENPHSLVPPQEPCARRRIVARDRGGLARRCWCGPRGTGEREKRTTGS